MQFTKTLMGTVGAALATVAVACQPAMAEAPAPEPSTFNGAIDEQNLDWQDRGTKPELAATFAGGLDEQNVDWQYRGVRPELVEVEGLTFNGAIDEQNVDQQYRGVSPELAATFAGGLDEQHEDWQHFVLAN